MSSDQAPGHRSQDAYEGVEELGPRDSGVWVVKTRHTTHTFDLDRRTYRREPGPSSTPMDFDGVTVTYSRLIYPAVGSCHLVFYDDPDRPELLEHWRKSSTISSITRQPHSNKPGTSSPSQASAETE